MAKDELIYRNPKAKPLPVREMKIFGIKIISNGKRIKYGS